MTVKEKKNNVENNSHSLKTGDNSALCLTPFRTLNPVSEQFLGVIDRTLKCIILRNNQEKVWDRR